MGAGFSEEVYRIPEFDVQTPISTCLPYTLEVSEIENIDINEVLEIRANLRSNSANMRQILNNSARIQIILPLEDPDVSSIEKFRHIKTIDNPSYEVERVSWKEGIRAEIKFRKIGNTKQPINIFFLIIFSKEFEDINEFTFDVDGIIHTSLGGDKNIFQHKIKFSYNQNLTYYSGENKKLIETLRRVKCYDLSDNASIIHPKQIHTYNTIYHQLLNQTKSSPNAPIDITYIGPDTGENLHSTLRAINKASKNGANVRSLTIGYTKWDRYLLDDVGILSKNYFNGKNLNFNVSFELIDNFSSISSDVIILTYVANWAYSNTNRGNAIEQFLGNIIKKMDTEKSILISVDPIDINKLTRSFYNMGSIETDLIYGNQGNLIEQKTSPGGYGDKLISDDREICWVRSYKRKSGKNNLKISTPRPNQLANLISKTNPAGRPAKINRLIYPHLHKTTYNELKKILQEGKAIERFNFVNINNHNLFYTKKMNIIVGGPGDGKSVLLQKLAWELGEDEEKLTILLSARSLSKEENITNLRFNIDSENLHEIFLETLEREANVTYPNLNWNSNVLEWQKSCDKTYIFIDAFDEIRDLQTRRDLFEIISKVNNKLKNTHITISFREAITDLIIDISNIETLENTPKYQIYKIIWEDAQLKHNFIPSLLHAWNMKLDPVAESELSYFLNLSYEGSNLNNSQIGHSINGFLKNPLRVVWLVKLIYDANKDLTKMNILDYESEILTSTVKDRFETRILSGTNLRDDILEEFLNVVFALAILDYPWNGNQIEFNFDNREKFIQYVFNSSDLISNLTNASKLEQYIFEDLSLLFITGDDNISWVHENLREHAISNGIIKSQSNGLTKSILEKWGIEPPSMKDIMFQSGDLCSFELTNTLIKSQPINVTIDKLSSYIDIDIKSSTEPIEKISILKDKLLLIVNDLRKEREQSNNLTKQKTKQRNQINAKVKKLIVQVKEQRTIREQMNEIVREKKVIRQEVNSAIKEIKSRMKSASETVEDDDSDDQMVAKPHQLRNELKAAVEKQKKAHKEVQIAVDKAQEAHELMVQLNREVDKQRNEAESYHKELRASKREADKYHKEFIKLVNILFTLNNIYSSLLPIHDTDKYLNENLVIKIKSETIKCINEQLSDIKGVKNNSNFHITDIHKFNEQIKIKIHTNSSFFEIIKQIHTITTELRKKFDYSFKIHLVNIPLKQDEVTYAVKEYFEQEIEGISYNEIYTLPLVWNGRFYDNRYIKISFNHSTRKQTWLRDSIEDHLVSKFGKPVSVKMTPNPLSKVNIEKHFTSYRFYKNISWEDAPKLRSITQDFTLSKFQGISGRKIHFPGDKWSRKWLNYIQKHLKSEFGSPISVICEDKKLQYIDEEIIRKELDLFFEKEGIPIEYEITLSRFHGNVNRKITLSTESQIKVEIYKKLKQHLIETFDKTFLNLNNPSGKGRTDKGLITKKIREFYTDKKLDSHLGRNIDFVEKNLRSRLKDKRGPDIIIKIKLKELNKHKRDLYDFIFQETGRLYLFQFQLFGTQVNQDDLRKYIVEYTDSQQHIKLHKIEFMYDNPQHPKITIGPLEHDPTLDFKRNITTYLENKTNSDIIMNINFNLENLREDEIINEVADILNNKIPYIRQRIKLDRLHFIRNRKVIIKLNDNEKDIINKEDLTRQLKSIFGHLEVHYDLYDTD